MPIDKFPFLRLGPDSPWQPMLLIELSNPANGFSVPALALVDTGADDCVVPEFYASRLGHDLENCKGKPREVMGIGGCAMAYTHTSGIKIFATTGTCDDPHVDYNKVVYSQEKVLINFVKGYNVPPALLGVKSFLKNFVVTLDYPNRNFSIKHP